VKLGGRDYLEWFRGRRDRDLAAGHRRTPTEERPAAQAKSEEKPPGAKSSEKESEQAKAQPKAEAKKESPKAQPSRRSVRRSGGPLVDKQLDKALEVIRSKLVAKEKAA
jgi:hypothetical protein